MDANELLKELEKVSIRTEKGTFVKVEDVRRLTEQRTEERAEVEAKPKPRTFHQAKAAVKKDEGLMDRFPKPVPHLGGTGLTEPQTSSRT